jgi:hypothetical protein
LGNKAILQHEESRNNTIGRRKVLLTLVIILLLAVLSIAFILHFRGKGTQFWVAVTSAHGSPTASAWVDNGTNFTASVTSPTEVVDNHQWVCTGFSVDGGALTPGTSYTFTSVTAGHTIVFSWNEQSVENNLHPAIILTMDVDNSIVENNTSVTYTYFVTNIGDTPLTVSISDDKFGSIDSGVSLNVGVSKMFKHMATLTQTTTNTATATGVAPNGAYVTSTAKTTVTVIKIVAKNIPSGYVMGFPVDAGLVNSMNVVFIQNSNQKVSFRFTAKLSGESTMLVVFAWASYGQPTVNIGLQEDNGGNPNGQWMNGNAFGTVQLPSATAFVTVQLPTAVAITQGRVYHVVIEAAGGSSDGTVGVETYKADGFAQPFNPDDPDIVWTDNRMTTMFYDGQSWQEKGTWPIFVVGYSDSRSEGQPYSLSAPWVVFGSTQVGQSIVPASNYKIAKMAFVVGLRGQPTDNLYYEVIDSSNNLLAKGLFTEASQLTAQRTWIEATLPTPVALTAGQVYRFILLSPQTDLQDCYLLFGHEFPYDTDYVIGYGGLQNQLTSSLDGGANWGDDPGADAIFELTNA